jgi:DNA-3-methyladenine glycosylase
MPPSPDPFRPPLALPPALGREAFARDAETVARALVGAVLVVRGPDRAPAAVRLVETEAYVGAHDLACHAARGRTARTAVMFGPAGHAYVYLVYGLHHLLNVVTGAPGEGQAVLLRAAEPLAGVTGNLSGPGRLAAALGITRADYGADLCAGPRSRLAIHPGPSPARLGVSERIGVGYAGDWAASPLRFYDPASPAVSGPRRLRQP